MVLGAAVDTSTDANDVILFTAGTGSSIGFTTAGPNGYASMPEGINQ
jgi:hypothetical protein